MDAYPSKNQSCRSNWLPQKSDKNVIDSDGHSTREWCALQEGFPPGFTVDELKNHRKRRPQNLSRPLDNLQIETGSLKYLKTEYNRRFVKPPNEYLSQRSARRREGDDWRMPDGEIHAVASGEYKDKFLEFPRERPRAHKPHPNLLPANMPMDFRTEKFDNYVAYKNVERTKSLRKNTALKPEGELFTETEMRHEFRPLGKSDRVRAVKRPTNLKLGGLFESLTSEQKEKYIAYLSNRPTALKKDPELRLDGDIDFSTECKEKYVYPGCKLRPALRKRSTSLKLQGEVDFTPEYRKSYVELPRCRASAVRPEGHLYAEGDLDMLTESRMQYMPTKLIDTPMSAKQPDNIHFTGDISLMPEYRQQFIAHGKSKSQIIRKQDNLNLEGEVRYETENIKYTPGYTSQYEISRSPSHSAMPGPLASSLSNSEYHSQFVDFPRGRPSVTKPTPNLINSGQFEMATGNSDYGLFRSGTHEVARAPSATLGPDGMDTGEAEYKSKYIEFPVTYSRTPKPLDTFSQDYQSFQMLDTSENKKNTEPLRPYDVTPSFRLEVHNADDKSRGFHRSPDRVFPREALTNNNFSPKKDLDAAVESAMKRRSAFEKADPNNGRSNTRTSKFDVNDNEPAFTVIDRV